MRNFYNLRKQPNTRVEQGRIATIGFRENEISEKNARNGNIVLSSLRYFVVYNAKNLLFLQITLKRREQFEHAEIL